MQTDFQRDLAPSLVPVLAPELAFDTLSPQQTYALNLFKERKNIFLTGPAGTGKSYLIKRMIHESKYAGREIQVCALTGIAAVILNCGARTIHSWSGIKLCRGTPAEIVQTVLKNGKAVSQWKSVDVLVVDEVSMMSQFMFDVLEKVARTVRRNNLPFGGLQVVFTGDMFQLPPIGNPDEPTSCLFCFESPQWHAIFPIAHHVELIHIFRQTDPVFVDILNQVRLGTLDETALTHLMSRVGISTEGKIVTKMYSTRVNVERINKQEFDKIKAPEYTNPLIIHTNATTWVESGKSFTPDMLADHAYLTQEQKENEVALLKSTLPYCAEVLHMKVGAVVMCVVNVSVEDRICNGSQGKIVQILHDHPVLIFGKPKQMTIPVVEFEGGLQLPMTPHSWQSSTCPCIVFTQIPLVHAWATTIHKSQGMTLNAAEMDLGTQIFENGQIYVALSRVRSLEGLYLTKLNPARIRANPRVVRFWKTFADNAITETTATWTDEESPIAVAELVLENEPIDPNVKRIHY